MKTSLIFWEEWGDLWPWSQRNWRNFTFFLLRFEWSVSYCGRVFELDFSLLGLNWVFEVYEEDEAVGAPEEGDDG